MTKKKKLKKIQVSPSEPCKLGLNFQIHNPLNFLSKLNPGA